MAVVSSVSQSEVRMCLHQAAQAEGGREGGRGEVIGADTRAGRRREREEGKEEER